jgi:hypothetical protein
MEQLNANSVEQRHVANLTVLDIVTRGSPYAITLLRLVMHYSFVGAFKQKSAGTRK